MLNLSRNTMLNRLNIFPEILKKLLIITKNVLNVSKNHLNISYFCRKYVPILNHLKFLAVAGVEEEDSGASMLSTSAAFFKICSFSA